MFSQKLVGRQADTWPHLYYKTREVVQPCNSAACHNWPHVMEPAYSNVVIHGHYTVTWPPVETCLKLCRRISCEYTVIL
jgi:hypothetical protein